MQFTLESVNHSKLVSNYGPGFFEINSDRYTSSICLHGNDIFENWQHGNSRSLSLQNFEQIIEARPEILILGTGKNLEFPKPVLMAELHKKGIVLEAMGTSAACRTYNVLVSERRRVAAALMMIEKE